MGSEYVCEHGCPVCPQAREENAGLRARCEMLENERDTALLAVGRLANERSDATRLLPIGGPEWREIRSHLHAWREDEISEGKLRTLIVLALREKTSPGPKPCNKCGAPSTRRSSTVPVRT